MKRLICYSILLLFIIGNIHAVDTESYQFINHLLNLSKPGVPEIYEDAIIFTATSSFHRVGIAFAHEDYANIYWFKKLMVHSEEIKYPKNPRKPYVITPTMKDSGILFHTYIFPPGLKELHYRLIINGLWTTDPANPYERMDQKSGISHSVVQLPEVIKTTPQYNEVPGHFCFNFSAPPGETVSVAGNFNNWDPFMYELKETSPGEYSLNLPLPPGKYHYVFYHRGQRLLDPQNQKKGYNKEGIAASEAIVF